MSRNIIVYTAYGCAACKATGDYLKQNGIPFRFINISQDPKLATELARRTGMQTVPQVFVDDKFVGGYGEVVAMHRNGQL
jgi:glutaredoxin 3